MNPDMDGGFTAGTRGVAPRRARPSEWSSTAVLILIALMAGACTDSSGADGRRFVVDCPGAAERPRRPVGAWLQPGSRQGSELLPGVTLLTGMDLKPFQTTFCIPELADPYVSSLGDSVVVSGTAQYHLRFPSMSALESRGNYQIIWNDYYYSDGTLMEGDGYHANSWDLKPSLWAASAQGEPRLWDAATDTGPPLKVWYGGHMRPAQGAKVAAWPADNYSRDVFAFVEKEPGKWVSAPESIFHRQGTWPRAAGDFRGHRYGHQLVTIPRPAAGGFVRRPVVFYEEVTETRPDGAPAATRIFMDEMESPFRARGNPVELVSPFDPKTGKPFPSAVREDGSALVEGPLYFRFQLEGELWEAIGFSAGSFYARYPAVFASRKVADGLQGKPYQVDLKDDGSDFHDAGAELGRLLNLTGGPARPAVIVGSDGMAIPDRQGRLQLLVHAYRKDVLPDSDDTKFPGKYGLHQRFRVVLHASLDIVKKPGGALRFRITTPSPGAAAPMPTSVEM